MVLLEQPLDGKEISFKLLQQMMLLTTPRLLRSQFIKVIFTLIRIQLPQLHSVMLVTFSEDSDNQSRPFQELCHHSSGSQLLLEIRPLSRFLSSQFWILMLVSLPPKPSCVKQRHKLSHLCQVSDHQVNQVKPSSQ